MYCCGTQEGKQTVAATASSSSSTSSSARGGVRADATVVVLHRTEQTAKKKTRTKKQSHQQDDTFLRRNGLLPETDFLSRSTLVLLLWTFRAAIVSWNVLFQRSTNQHLFFINHGGKTSYFSPVQSQVTIVPPWVNRPPTLVPWAQTSVVRLFNFSSNRWIRFFKFSINPITFGSNFVSGKPESENRRFQLFQKRHRIGSLIKGIFLENFKILRTAALHQN